MSDIERLKRLYLDQEALEALLTALKRQGDYQALADISAALLEAGMRVLKASYLHGGGVCRFNLLEKPAQVSGHNAEIRVLSMLTFDPSGYQGSLFFGLSMMADAGSSLKVRLYNRTDAEYVEDTACSTSSAVFYDFTTSSPLPVGEGAGMIRPRQVVYELRAELNGEAYQAGYVKGAWLEFRNASSLGKEGTVVVVKDDGLPGGAPVNEVG